MLEDVADDRVQHGLDALSFDGERARRVAEVDGRVVGYVWAVLQQPDPGAQRGGTRYPGQLRVWVNSLIVQQAHARRGIASRLMGAVEDWARDRGAELVMLQTWADSPESVPFYERIGYRPRAIIFQRELKSPTRGRPPGN